MAERITFDRSLYLPEAVEAAAAAYAEHAHDRGDARGRRRRGRRSRTSASTIAHDRRATRSAITCCTRPSRAGARRRWKRAPSGAAQRDRSRSPTLADDALGFFRWGRVARQGPGHQRRRRLGVSEPSRVRRPAGRAHRRRASALRRAAAQGFLRDGLDLDALAERMAQRNRHVRRGPHLHVVTLTQRARPTRRQRRRPSRPPTPT